MVQVEWLKLEAELEVSHQMSESLSSLAHVNLIGASV